MTFTRNFKLKWFLGFLHLNTFDDTVTSKSLRSFSIDKIQQSSYNIVFGMFSPLVVFATNLVARTIEFASVIV